MIKLRERAETLGVVLFFKDTNTNNLKDYYRQCRQTGALIMRYQSISSFKQALESLVTVKAMCLLDLLQTCRKNIKI